MPESASFEIARLTEDSDSDPDSSWIHVWTIGLEKHPEPVKQRPRVLDHYERERAQRFKFDWLRTAYINRWTAYRKILACYTKDLPATVAIERSRHGRPFLPAHPIEFSTSSSAGFALLAISDSQVGVDLEQKNKALFTDGRTADSFLSATEFNYLQTVSPARRWKLLFDCWTLKEAYLKGMGTGLLTDPRSVTIDLENRSLVPTEQTLSDDRWTLHQPDLLEDYSVAIASAEPEPGIKFFDLEELPPALNR